jgi:tRNA-(ms[2]io[6]A)-hydroxylase
VHRLELGILQCETPDAWLEKALATQDVLLIDHAHCEKKAALTALSLISRYEKHVELVQFMSRLAREELRHFEQVLRLMTRRNIQFINITAARYAAGLIKHACTHEPVKLVDLLLIGAFVEARSCERFSRLVPHLDEELSRFYAGLLAAEARHHQGYLKFAEHFAQKDLTDRIAFFGEIEKELILSPDPLFRFHSGAPA